MGLSLLAPLFIAGVGLLVAPYLIHQIRRPEREPIRFSSVMFIPNIHKEVIERRRIQHILLMLLRMLLLLLLAAAFARPYWKALAAEDGEEFPVRHVILLDTSYSMATRGVFERAQRAAREAVADIESGESISVMTFARFIDVVAPFPSQAYPDAGSKEAARAAIDSAEVSSGHTDYLSALELAEQRAASSGAGESERLVLHLVSDFQASGLPKRHSGWKLSPTVELDLVPIRSDFARNYAVTDTHIRKSSDSGLRVLAKVRNWSDKDIDDLDISLVLNGETTQQNTLSVRARSATQTSFRLDPITSGTIEGYLELESDDLTVDDRRYFTWNSPRKMRVLLVAEDRPNERWPASWFFQQALAENPDLPWTAQRIEPNQLDETLNDPSSRPAVVVACNLAGTSSASARSLLKFAEEGGQILYLLNASADPDGLNAVLFEGRGVTAIETRYSDTRPARFEVMSWVDLDHPIFVPFQGTRFNDFSALRFFNYMRLEISEDAQVLARFDDDSPAMVEVPVGGGRLIIWPFALQLEWTNLPKNPRFIPLLYETLRYLGDLREGAATWEIGERIPLQALVVDESGRGTIRLPGSPVDIEIRMDDEHLSEQLLLQAPGFFRTKQSGAGDWKQVDATNVAPEEGDLTPITAAEFLQKVTTSPQLSQNRRDAGIVGANIDNEGFSIQKEYGRTLIFALLAFALVEGWYMSWLKA